MAGHRRGGFSLIELLVVIIIIALVVAIVVPSLFGARNAARNASTQGLMVQVQGAAQKFETDNHRLPGHFTPREMGMQSNETQGFGVGENVMLDLAGGVVSGSPTGPNQIGVGPDPARLVTVDVKQIGLGEVYFAPPEKFFKAQPTGGQITVQQSALAADDDQLPDLVDAWQSPLLFWVKDDTAIRPIDPQNDSYMCAQNCGNGQQMTASARYYWASNAGFLKATALGKKALDQRYIAGEACSLIGESAPGITGRPGAPSLEALLGSPNFPYRATSSMTPQNGQFSAAEARGSFIIQSAGANGYYVGSRERGGQMYTTRGGSDTGILQYGWSQQNLALNPPTPHTDKDGKTTNIDIIKDFDDLLSTGSN